jgi:glycosyltransferase involved in cell wall biosynthesis
MRLLFFSHACGRTGSELALYNLIRRADWTNIKIAVACGARGELANAFPSDVRVFNYSHALSFGARAFKSSSAPVWFTDRAFGGIIRLIHERFRPDAWYINSIVQPRVLTLARELRVPCILHTHELEPMLSSLSPGEVECMIAYPKLIIAGSDCAADVMRTLGRQENIEVCYESIDIDRLKIDTQKSVSIRQDLGIPPDAFVWAMSGTRDPNKNPAGFVGIAHELLKQAPDTYFMWLRGTDTGYSLYAKALATSLQIDDRIFWLPEETENYFDYLNVADGFVLTSFKESLSLVTLEAAALGKPFVSFNSGGPKEIFRDGMGAVVDSWNVQDMVTAMVQVMRGDIYVNADISKARAAEFDVSAIVKQWQRTVMKCLRE